MRTGKTWLAMLACGGIAQSAIAANFTEIQLWVRSGWQRPEGFAALADGTLQIVRPGDAQKLDHEQCAQATREEMEVLERLIGQIPANAPWGRQWMLPDRCSDEAEASLLVTTARGDLDVRYSLMCTPANVPRWVTELVRTMRQLREKHAACGTKPVA